MKTNYIGLVKHKLIDLARGTSVVQDYYAISKEVNKGIGYLDDIRKSKLINLLQHAKENVPFYKRLLSNYSINEMVIDPFSILESLPVISKENIIQNRSDFISRKKIPHIINHTGGSTGDPLEYLVDKTCISRTRAYDLYFWNKAFNYYLGDTILKIGGSSLGSSQGISMKIYNYLQSKISVEGGLIPLELLRKNVEIIAKGDFDVIYAYPSSLYYYVNYAIDNNIYFKGKIKGIATTSESLLPGVRKKLEEYFNTDVIDVYGARDGGVVGDECICKDGFHYNYQDCVINEYRQTSYQESPELLLTNLTSFSMPLIKYRVGDMGELSTEKCKCGSPLPKIKDFSGRTRDLIILPSGNTIHGSVFNKIVRHYPEIHQYQIIKKEKEIVFIIKGNKIDINKKLTGIKAELLKIIGREIEITIEISEDFTLTSAGKLRTIIVQE